MALKAGTKAQTIIDYRLLAVFALATLIVMGLISCAAQHKDAAEPSDLDDLGPASETAEPTPPGSDQKDDEVGDYDDLGDLGKEDEVEDKNHDWEDDDGQSANRGVTQARAPAGAG